MAEYALGLIETKGLVGAIEAADAMLKAANVVLVGKERTDPAMITIKIVGDTAAVRAAVDAGAAAAQRVGSLISVHVIPRPAENVDELIFVNNAKTQSRTQEEAEAILRGDAAVQTELPLEDEDDHDAVPEEAYTKPADLSPELEKYFEKLDAMTVHELRRFARSVKDLPIYGREISRANKKQLLEELMKAKKGAQS
jgi:microcompartment protein CcmL/EutN